MPSSRAGQVVDVLSIQSVEVLNPSLLEWWGRGIRLHLVGVSPEVGKRVVCSALMRSAAGCAAMTLFVSCAGIALTDIRTPLPVPDGSCVVVGFLGGRDRWNDETKGVRQLAQKLTDSSVNVHAETFENRRRDVALEFVERARRGRQRIRLVVYGQSFGGAAVVKFARELQALDIPIDLTIQIDSVGRGDGRIPPNVRFAANAYQDDGWFLEGEHPIEAEDPTRTLVLGNRRFDYDSPPGKDVSLAQVPWYKLVFRIAHARMDRDPRVWSTVEHLVRAACAGELHPDVLLSTK